MDQKYDIETMTDEQIVEAILDRKDQKRRNFVTTEFLYKKCYPLFSDIFNRYYTDCENCTEFINEIYLYIVMPQMKKGEETMRCKLENFQFRCSLTMWLKIVTLNYCYQLYAKHKDLENIDDIDGRFDIIGTSLLMDSRSIDMQDIYTILSMMPNQRYRSLIEYRHIGGHTDSETAEYLNMTMANYYNKHRLAKAQFVAALKKEGLI